MDAQIMTSVGGDIHDFVAENSCAVGQAETHLKQYRRSWDISPEDMSRLTIETEKWLES
jgi:hypothetical protein